MLRLMLHYFQEINRLIIRFIILGEHASDDRETEYYSFKKI